MMTASQVIFYVLAVFILATGLLSVTTGKIFRSAIWLLFSLMGIAGLYFWMEVEFIAAVQIVVYVGGIVVLIIFSIFLTQQSGKEMPKPPRTRLIASVLAVLLGFGLMTVLIFHNNFRNGISNDLAASEAARQPFDAGVAHIGSQMLDTGEKGYALPFEVISILLLAAMIGCIVIAMKTTPGTQSKSI
jgi:NADH-quinone oxidoreductase subunit J